MRCHSSWLGASGLPKNGLAMKSGSHFRPAMDQGRKRLGAAGYAGACVGFDCPDESRVGVATAGLDIAVDSLLQNGQVDPNLLRVFARIQLAFWILT
ncbi:MAG: hypothetical protein ACOY7J_19930 [Pseudomonadota bacterium]